MPITIITFADDVDFANNSLGTFSNGVAYGGWTLTNSGTATGVGKIVNDAEKGKVFEYEITAVGGGNGDAKLTSENSCSILTGTTSQVNFKIYFDLKSNQVDDSNKGDMIWKVGLSDGSIQQKDLNIPIQMVLGKLMQEPKFIK